MEKTFKEDCSETILRLARRERDLYWEMVLEERKTVSALKETISFLREELAGPNPSWLGNQDEYSAWSEKAYPERRFNS